MTDILEIIRPHVHLERQGKITSVFARFIRRKRRHSQLIRQNRLFAVWVAVPTVMPGSLQN